MSVLTVVLVHGAGHTAGVWADVRAAMVSPTFVVDLPGRGARPAPIATVTIAQAADSVAADVQDAVEGDVVLVAHSVAGTVLPSVAALLGDRVRHMVFVAGVTAPEGELPLEQFMPGQTEVVAARLRELRHEHGGAPLEAMDVKTASSIDSLNLSSQPMAWAGVPASLGRTFVRCLRDPIQPRDMQARFAASCGAGEVVDIDAGHTPAIDAPAALAAILDHVLARVDAAAASAPGG